MSDSKEIDLKLAALRTISDSLRVLSNGDKAAVLASVTIMLGLELQVTEALRRVM